MGVFYKSKNFKSKTEFDIMRDIAYAFIKSGHDVKMNFSSKDDEEVVLYQKITQRGFLFVEDQKYFLSQDGIDFILNFFEENIKLSLKKKYIKGYVAAI